MKCEKLVFWLSFLIVYSDSQEILENEHKIKSDRTHDRYRQQSSYSLLSNTMSQVSHQSAVDSCNDDIVCLSMATGDKLGLEAIRSLHQQLDDDANGNIDLSESDDFLREELKYDSGYEKRQKAFHRNDDMHISVRELWEAWLKSEVHNWTVEQTSEWLAVSVDLPQYVPNFIQNRVNGAALPRLAVNNMNYLTNVIGVKDPIHKQKIALKAMDVVLFGPPKEPQNLWKDLTLVTLIACAIIGSWYTWIQRNKSRDHLARMMRDMEQLQKAENALEELQRELERAKLAQENVACEKQDLERRLLERGDISAASGDGISTTNGTGLTTSCSDLEISQLRAEVEMLRAELQVAEGELRDRCWSPPLALQHWLQLTHELENRSYTKKKQSAERQLQQAREACEKLRKKRTSLVGAFVSTHGKSIDDVDRSIVEARTSLNEVTQELQERVYRWKQIELLTGFTVVNNNGLHYLEGMLYRGNPARLKGRNSQDDLSDDTSSVYTSSCPGHLDGLAGTMPSGVWREQAGADSSGSEASKHDDESPNTNNNNVQFIVGDQQPHSWPSDDHITNNNTTPVQKEHTQRQPVTTVAVYRHQSQPPIPVSSRTSNASIMTRSQSHDVNMSSEAQVLSGSGKQSQSDGSLGKNHTPKTIREQAVGFEEETGSTDSTSSAVDEEVKKRRRKLFPTFSKKNKEKEKLAKEKAPPPQPKHHVD